MRPTGTLGGLLPRAMDIECPHCRAPVGVTCGTHRNNGKPHGDLCMVRIRTAGRPVPCSQGVDGCPEVHGARETGEGATTDEDIERLNAAEDALRIWVNWAHAAGVKTEFVCPQCGPGAASDEDGCCATCGTGVTVHPVGGGSGECK